MLDGSVWLNNDSSSPLKVYLRQQLKEQGKHTSSLHTHTSIWSTDEVPADGKIFFKKPAKRSSSDKFHGISASSSKKKKTNDGGEEEEEEEKEVKSGKKIKNNSLLSFGGDEEEEEY